jgi:hypothetical protein
MSQNGCQGPDFRRKPGNGRSSHAGWLKCHMKQQNRELCVVVFREEVIDCPNLNPRRLARLRRPSPPSASKKWRLVAVMMHIKRILFKGPLAPFMLVCSRFTTKLCGYSNGSSAGSDTVRKGFFSTVVQPTTSHHHFRPFLRLPPAYWVCSINPTY